VGHGPWSTVKIVKIFPEGFSAEGATLNALFYQTVSFVNQSIEFI